MFTKKSVIVLAALMFLSFLSAGQPQMPRHAPTPSQAFTAPMRLSATMALM